MSQTVLTHNSKPAPCQENNHCETDSPLSITKVCHNLFRVRLQSLLSILALSVKKTIECQGQLTGIIPEILIPYALLSPASGNQIGSVPVHEPD